MFLSLYTTIAVGLMACGVLAAPATSGDLIARQSFSGQCVTLFGYWVNKPSCPTDPSSSPIYRATFYYQNGNAGSCGQVHSDQDHIVAIRTSLLEDIFGKAYIDQHLTFTATELTVVQPSLSPIRILVWQLLLLSPTRVPAALAAVALIFLLACLKFSLLSAKACSLVGWISCSRHP